MLISIYHSFFRLLVIPMGRVIASYRLRCMVCILVRHEVCLFRHSHDVHWRSRYELFRVGIQNPPLSRILLCLLYILTLGVFMEFALIGFAVFFNIAFIKWKFDRRRYLDACLDTFLMIVVMILFSGSYSALVVGTLASALVSIFLFVSPPKVSLPPFIRDFLAP